MIAQPLSSHFSLTWLLARLAEQLGQFYAYWYVNTDQAVEASRLWKGAIPHTSHTASDDDEHFKVYTYWRQSYLYIGPMVSVNFSLRE